MGCISYWVCTETEGLQYNDMRLEISSDDYDEYYLVRCDILYPGLSLLTFLWNSGKLLPDYMVSHSKESILQV
jgi:hypothetical protein